MKNNCEPICESFNSLSEPTKVNCLSKIETLPFSGQFVDHTILLDGRDLNGRSQARNVLRPPRIPPSENYRSEGSEIRRRQDQLRDIRGDRAPNEIRSFHSPRLGSATGALPRLEPHKLAVGEAPPCPHFRPRASSD
jgi:hypothetical protein